MSRYRSQVREVINRNTVVSLAMAQGFNAFLPVYDGGIDFILYRESDGLVRKVQLKGRWIIDRKYVGRDIWVAFPIGTAWYLMPHDEMLAQANAQGVSATASWVEGGAYSKPRPSKATIAACARISSPRSSRSTRMLRREERSHEAQPRACCFGGPLSPIERR